MYVYQCFANHQNGGRLRAGFTDNNYYLVSIEVCGVLSLQCYTHHFHADSSISSNTIKCTHNIVVTCKSILFSIRILKLMFTSLSRYIVCASRTSGPQGLEQRHVRKRSTSSDGQKSA